MTSDEMREKARAFYEAKHGKIRVRADIAAMCVPELMAEFAQSVQQEERERCAKIAHMSREQAGQEHWPRCSKCKQPICEHIFPKVFDAEAQVMAILRKHLGSGDGQ